MFSVVIPVHNKLPHLERSINSVLNQTYQDFEIILIDDASSDGSTEKLQEFTDARISTYRRETPGPGGYAARNLGIEKAKGEWVAFLDADDEWYPHHLEKMNKLALEYPDAYFMSCGWEFCRKNFKKSNPFYTKKAKKGSIKISVKDYLKNGIIKSLPVWTSVAMVKRSSPIATNLFPADSGVKRGGDLHAWLKFICHHKEMAWSNHIGAIYHTESVNMVTKKAKSSFYLWNRVVFNELTKKLNMDETKLLKNYYNHIILPIVLKSGENSFKYKRYIILNKNSFYFNLIYLHYKYYYQKIKNKIKYTTIIK